MAKYTLAELRNLQEDDELDLSASGIHDFPNPIIQLTRLTNLDLSSNSISILPESFCKMTKLVRLDFGSNGLHHLPDGIGFLVNLQHLNLYNNKLEDLPNSFANLKSLKWLDLKKNPLNPKLLAVAGTCSSDAECKKAAKQVVDVYMGERKKAIDAQKAQEAKLRAKVQKAQEEEKIRKFQEKKQKQEAAKKEEKELKQREAVRTGNAAPVPKVQKAKEAPSKKSVEEHKKSAEKPRGFFSKLFGFIYSCFFYLTIALLTSSTIAIAFDCYGVGTPIPGTAPLCKDLTRLGKFEKTSPQFFSNVKVAYGQVFHGYHEQIKPHVAPLQKKVSTQWKQFAKTDIGKKVEKIAYQVHSWIVEKFVQLQRFIKKQSDVVAAWWKKDGQKTFGPYLEGFVVGLKMVFQVVLDVLRNVFSLVSHFAVRVKIFFNAFMEGGFNAAMNTLNH